MDILTPNSFEFPPEAPAPEPRGPSFTERVESVWTHPLEGYGFIAPTTQQAALIESEHARIFSLALELSATASKPGLLDAASFFQRHGADSAQGIALMMLAESLARAPGDKARQALLFDILPRADWDGAGAGDTALESLAKLSSRFHAWSPGGSLSARLKSFGEAAAAKAAMAAITAFAKAFIAGNSLGDLRKLASKKTLCSFDMLGESACTEAEAGLYFQRYMRAIEALPATAGLPWDGHGVSVKISALDPLYDRRHPGRTMARDRLCEIAKACESKNILLTVDAEEAERLTLSLELIAYALDQLRSKDYEGFGWAIQSNLRSCGDAVEHAASSARSLGRRLPIRLVKGAYWDSETRKAIAGGYANPAWPAKSYTDRAWLAGAEALLREPRVYPMLATHNPHSCAAGSILGARMGGPFEFQRLHGMSAELHGALEARGHRSRVYAPIGAVEELLPYLARRMLENGANTSILRVASEPGFDPGAAFANPFTKPAGPLAPSWESAFEPERSNSPGFPLWMGAHGAELSGAARSVAGSLRAGAGAGEAPASSAAPVLSPCQSALLVGQTRASSSADIESTIEAAHQAYLRGGVQGQSAHDKLLATRRALLIKRRTILGAIVAETGKRMEDAINEWREACDFCAFHANQALAARAPRRLPSLPGEENILWRVPRGVALCVSPWNFPFAILMGQASAALAAGCPVIAKGASSAALCSQLVVDCLREGGFAPSEASHIVAPGSQMASLVSDARVGAIAFTGSTAAARAIAKTLAGREGPMARLIAETGGFNLMLVDESAHLDSACQDILESAFNMSGQRCSSLRAAWIDARVFDPLMAKLEGALRARSLGNPFSNLHVDYGPLIDTGSALEALAHFERLLAIPGHALRARAQRPEGLSTGAYFAPAIVETRLDTMLREEMFAPILQVARFEPGQEERMASSWAQAGYGLTFGIQTRKPAAAEQWALKAPAGNIYINRPLVGATVCSQPFGGEGLSGTGPKIGGSDYVLAFGFERALSNNSAAFGGCVDLLGDGRASLHRFFPGLD